MKTIVFAKLFLIIAILLIWEATIIYAIKFITEPEINEIPKISIRLKPNPPKNHFLSNRIELKTLYDLKENLIEEEKDFIEADLGVMILRFYKKGEIIKEYPILVKGKEEDFGETASGLFKIKRMREVAFSNMGEVYMPWWMEFWGNYSIHGWPYYPGGIPTTRSFSSGCINLKTQDAKELYKISKLDLPVLVLEKDFKNDDFIYTIPAEFPSLPDISAKAYLVADLKNNFVFLEKDSGLILPMASITKLMTSLVASENFILSYDLTKTTKIKITEEMILPIGYTPGIDVGKKYTYFELLYPALMFSSNDAAEALAIRYGKDKFLDLMNQRAESLGMINTKFNDSYGYDAGNVSTAEDLFYLARYLLNNRKWLLEISKGKVFNNFGELQLTNLKNFNLFQDDPDFIGGKVGATPIAKKTGIFIFNLRTEAQQRPIAIIILSGDDNENNVKEILNWIKSVFSNN